MDYKAAVVPFEVKQTEEDENYFKFEGYASTKDIDLVDDIVEPTAFDAFLNKEMPVMLWQHDSREPVGVFDEAKSDDQGLFVRGRMPKEDTMVSGRIMPQMKIGSVKAMSIGFRVRRAKYDNEKGIRIIKEADLPEVSLVTFPANPAARVTALKSMICRLEGKKVISRGKLPKEFADRSYRWDVSAAEKRIREWAGAEDGPNEKYASNFLFVEGDMAEEFGGYKLLVTDIVDGERVVVPRAVFAVRAVLAGSRGGVDLQEADRKKVEGVVNLLYEGMDMEAPFDSDGKALYFTKSELEGLAVSDLRHVIRRGNISREAAKAVAESFLSGSDGGKAPGSGGDDLEALIGLKKALNPIQEE